ncbi:ATP-binding cassette domain-containing protein [Methanosarcina sp. DH2]|uniref:ABC transporter ATP-binding protein n=1 Tax=Methanosarcina sp. DH2 TaxID=2605639 RepID=UPI001E366A83|nr:ABC transporter ATP-binding protein [Methanosarcina sp. DH2]MCC4769184.1 ATP-binding cassette domain-containing protein [Methanosarcina sp. DH2]
MTVEVDIEKKFYGRKHGKKAENPSFSMHCSFDASSDFMVLFGCSGSGKTTALRCIAGLENPDSGSIRINGTIYFDSKKKINLPPQKRKIGYMFQENALFPHMNVRQNIEFGLKGLSSMEKKERVNEMLDLVGIEEFEFAYPDELSGGQKQKVALARALAPDPEILLLDEPFSSLDTVVRLKLRKELRTIRKRLGIPVIFITHDPVEAFTMADGMVVFDCGRVQQMGSPEDVFYHPKSRYVAELVGFSNLFDDAVVEGHGKGDECTFLWTLGTEITAPYIERMAGDKVSWGIRPENIELVDRRNVHNIQKEDRKNLFDGVIMNVVNKGTSRIMSLILKESEDVLKVEVANHVFDSLKIETGDECMVRLRTSDMIVF